MSSKEDTQPGGKLYNEAMARGVDVARKVTESDGPLHFNATEAETLRVLMLGLQRQAHIAQETNYAIAAALYRKHLQIVSHASDDGTFTVDLVVEPEPQPETVN
jgi:hypothetical protein